MYDTMATVQIRNHNNCNSSGPPVHGSYKKSGVLLWGPYLRDSIILGPYQVPVILENSDRRLGSSGASMSWFGHGAGGLWGYSLDLLSQLIIQVKYEDPGRHTPSI